MKKIMRICKVWPLLSVAFYLLPFSVAGQEFHFPTDDFSAPVIASSAIRGGSFPGNGFSGYNANTYGIPFGTTSHTMWQNLLSNPTNWQTKWAIPVANDFLKVSINHDDKSILTKYKYRLSFTINRHDNPLNAAAITGVESPILDIEYDPAAGVAYKDVAVYKFSGCYSFDVTLNNVQDISTSVTNAPTVSRTSCAPNIVFETKISLQTYDIVTSANYLQTSNTPVNNNTQLQVNWAINPNSSSCHLLTTQPLKPIRPVVYDLEWIYIEDYQYDPMAGGQVQNAFSSGLSVFNYDFRNNATRIRTYNTSYTIPLTYEKGLILYRVRALRPDQGFQQLSVSNNWTLTESGTYSLSGANCLQADGFIISQQSVPQVAQNEKFNWQYNISFAEDGKYKHVINYFDGLNKNRQNLTWLNSLYNNTGNGYVVAQQNVYDLEGRPSIKSLPIPVQTGSLSFLPGLLNVPNGNNGTRPLGAIDFDNPLAVCGPVLIPSLAPGTLGNQYYSTSNPNTTGMDNFIPNANGYPYVETIYSADNTNKVIYQGGAGDKHQPWTGHATNYDYVRAGQSEINRLFGTETGRFEFYPKQIVTDPNGQTSFSIYDPAGKVIATGLAGSTPAATDFPLPIDRLPSQPLNPAWTVKELLTGIKPQLIGNKVQWSTSFYNEADVQAGGINPIAVTYSASVPKYQICNQYLTPVLKYSPRILDYCGNVKYPQPPATPLTLGSVTPPSNTGGLVTEPASGVPGTGTIPPVFSKGKYIVDNSIELNRDAMQGQIAQYFDTHSASRLALASPGGNCYLNKDEFIYDKVTRTTYPCGSAPADDVKNDCDVKRLQMMKELYPGAKYGGYAQDAATGKYAGEASNSIFTIMNLNAGATAGIFNTGLDANGQPLAANTFTTSPTIIWTTPGQPIRDHHWQYSHDGVAGWDDAYTVPPLNLQNGVYGGSLGNNFYGRPWITSETYRCPQSSSQGCWTYFKTTIVVNAQNINSLTCHFGGDMEFAPLPQSPVPWTMEYFVNGAAQPVPANWDNFIPQGLHTGSNEIMVKCWNINDVVSFAATFTGVGPESRYQSSCINLPASVTKYGVQYTNLAALPHQTFIDIFNDDIAAALLPLHPEYCKLKLCDHYTEDINDIKTYQDAVAAGRSTLAQLVANDPLKIQSTFTTADLSYPNGNTAGKYIDQLALAQAYCGTEDKWATEHCVSYLYQYELANGIVPAGVTADEYWTRLKALYTGNRDYLKYKRYAAPAGTCGPCSSDRMQLVPPPVFQTEALTAGTTDPVSGNIIDPDIAGILNNPSTGTSLPASAQTHMTQDRQARIDAIIAGIVAQMKSCGITGTGFLSPFAVSLRASMNYSGVGTDEVPELTPAHVEAALAAAGISKNDLCNAFLADYATANNLGAKSAPRKFICKKDAFYNDLLSFLNRADILPLLKGTTAATATGMVLNTGNPFEAYLLNYITAGMPLGTTVSVAADLKSITVGYGASVSNLITKNVRTLTFDLQQAGGGNQAVTIPVELDFEANEDNNVAVSDMGSIMAVRCNNTPGASALNSALAPNTVLLTASLQSINGGTIALTCWSKQLRFLDDAGAMNEDNTLTCVDARNGLTAFNTDAATYQYGSGANHPLFHTALTNYLNYKYRRAFVYDDYEKLLNGCSVSEQIATPQYTAPVVVDFNSGGTPAAFYDYLIADGSAQNVQNPTASSSTPGGRLDFKSYRDGNSVWHFYIDLTGVNPESLVQVKAAVLAAAATNGGTATYLPAAAAGQVIALGQPAPVSQNLTSIAWNGNTYNGQTYPPNPHFAAPDNAYQVYTFPINTASPAAAAADLASLRNLLSTAMPGASIITGTKLWRSDASAERTAYLSYIYGLPAAYDRGQVVAAITPTGLQPVYGSQPRGYEEIFCDAPVRSLYVGGSTADATVAFMLGKVNAVTASKPFSFGPNAITCYSYPAQTVAGALPPQVVTAYRNSDGSYWFRYFDANHKLYSIFLGLPAEVPNPAGWTFASYAVAPSYDGVARALTVTLTRYNPATQQTENVVCRGYLAGAFQNLAASQKVSDVVLHTPNSPGICLAADNCEHEMLLGDIQAASQAFDKYRTDIISTETGKYYNYVAANVTSQLSISLPDLSYHYMLYYYDLAGNVVKTVPPAGVTPLPLTAPYTSKYIDGVREGTVAGVSPQALVPWGLQPVHGKATVAKYNSRNQPVWQQSPDGGQTYFFYDGQGRLRFSQNSRQRPLGRYSYTRYDELSRVVEAGEVQLDNSPAPAPANATDFTLNSTLYSFSPPNSMGLTIKPLVFSPYAVYCGQYSNDEFNAKLKASTRYDVVATLYDQPSVAPAQQALVWHGATQDNLRNRVASVRFYDALYGPVLPDWKLATHFSYDAIGNVKTLIQDCPSLSALGMQYVRVDYEYDLASGKVNTLYYNRGKADQFYHRFDYDADNRLTKTETSNDGVIWDRDAEYEYYKHGPLARTKVGDSRVQSLEYAYTIQGWLKAINGETLHPETDMGGNGLTASSAYPKDVMSHALDYFPGDYDPIGNTALKHLPDPLTALYNGNIVRQTTGISPAAAAMQDLVRSYRYDQLNRLTLAANNGVQAVVVNSPGGTGTVISSLQPFPNNGPLSQVMGAWGSSYSYDADGNIKTLKRTDGSGAALDDLSYGYPYTNNKLGWVSDAVAGTTGPDYHDHSLLLLQNPGGLYQYDGAGNLIKDIAESKTMSWTAWGKVGSIYDAAAGRTLNFGYDGGGNRFSKEVVTGLGGGNQDHAGEYYVRDGAGQLLATYRRHSVWNAKSLFTSLTTGVTALPDGVKVLGAAAMLYPSAQGAVLSRSLGTTAGQAWVRTRSQDYSVSEVLSASPDAFDQFMFGSRAYLDSLFTGGSDSIIVATLMEEVSSDAGGDGGGRPLLTTLLADSVAGPLTLGHLCREGDGKGTDALMGMLKARKADIPDTDCDSMARQAWLVYGAGESRERAEVLAWVTAGWLGRMDDDAVGKIYTAIVEDSGAMAAVRYAGSPFEAQVRDVLRRYYAVATHEERGDSTAEANELLEYIDNWAGARGLLDNVVDAKAVGQGLFAIDGEGYIADWLGQSGEGTGVLDTALADAGVSPQAFGAQLKGIAIDKTVADVGLTIDAALMVSSPAVDSMILGEHYIYGSQRVGIKTYGEAPESGLYNSWNVSAAVGNKSYLSAQRPWLWVAVGSYQDGLQVGSLTGNWYLPDVFYTGRVVGRKQYELSDHLGNVLATVSDKKVGIGTNGSQNGFSLYDHWEADLISTQDYYPGGMPMGQRTIAQNLARASYNGQKRDDEVYGVGMLNTAKYWEYDTRLMRRWNIDPVPTDGVSPYATNLNNPIQNSDPNGDCPWCIGAILGMAFDAGFQLAEIAIRDDMSLSDFSWKSVAISGVAGATGVGMGAFIENRIGSLALNGAAKIVVTKSASIAGNTVLGEVTDAAKAIAEGKKPDWSLESWKNNAIQASVGEAVGSATEKYLKNKAINSAEGKALEKQAERTERVARNNPKESPTAGRNVRAQEARKAYDAHVKGSATKAAIASSGLAGNATSAVLPKPPGGDNSGSNGSQASAMKVKLPNPCFTAGTAISTSHGLVNIEDIKNGDSVLSYNVESRKLEYQKVINWFQSITDTLIILNIGNETIHTTPAHSFYVNEGVWIPARALSENDIIWYASGKKDKIGRKLTRLVKSRVYNFEVLGNRNYFITGNRILVHNGKDLQCR